MEQERHQLQVEREALSKWIKKQSPGAQVPEPPSPLPLLPKEDPDIHDNNSDNDMVTKVLL